MVAKQTPPVAESIAQSFSKAIDFMLYSIPPGPKVIPYYIVINIQKGLTGIAMFLAMIYYNNFSLGCWVYLSLHGTYGLLWLLKETIFPDPKWRQNTTILSCFCVLSPALLAYWGAAYLMVSGQGNQDPTAERIAFCVTMFSLGTILMMCADLQKMIQLKFKKGLIADGFFKYTRNPNYLGEMMIYGSFAFLTGEVAPWIVLAFVWGSLFFPTMFVKDHLSLRKKAGWDNYQEHSWLLIPKISGSCIVSLVVYGALAAIGYLTYVEGSLASVLLKLRPTLLDLSHSLKLDL